MSQPKLMPLAILSGIVLLAGCGLGWTGAKYAAKSPLATSLSPTSSKKISVTVRVPPADREMEVKAFENRVERFESNHPLVDLTMDNWQYSPDEIGIKMAAHQVSTAYNTYASEGRVLLNRKWMSNISELFRQWEHTKELNPMLMKPFTLGGSYYAVPQEGYIMTVTINTKLFRDKGIPLPPLDWTWDDMLQAARLVSDPAKEIAGFAPMTKGNEAGWNWTNFLFAAGGEVVTVNNGKVKAAFNSEAGRKALEFYQKLKDESALPQNWVLGYDDAFNMFASGKSAMVMAGGGYAVDYAISHGLKAADLAVYPIPSFVKGGRHIGISGGNYHVISPYASAEQKQWAFRFLTDEYFTDDAVRAVEQEIKDRKETNQAYVPVLINYWQSGSDFDRKMQAVMDRYDNVYHYNPDLFGLLEGKEESPYEAQSFYAEMTNVIQDVFTSKTKDLKQRLDQAAQLMQTRVFDKIHDN
jgi:multiple sugar transport system substrate-binding protein